MGNMSGSYGSHYTLWQSITQNSQDIVNNKSNVTVNMYLSFDGSSYYAYTKNATSGSMTINGSTTNYSIASINFSSGQAKDILLATWTGDIEHNPDGTKTLSVSGSWNTNTSRIGSGSCSASKTLSTIPRASTITCSTANIGSNPSIAIKSASSSFTHKVYAYFGSISDVLVLDGVKGGTYTSWTIPDSFYTQIPNNKQGQGTIRCYTYSGSTKIGEDAIPFYVTTSKEKCTPSISGTVVDTNQTTINLTGDANKLIKYKSTAKATISASAKNGASISKKVINGTTVSGNELSIANVSTTSFVFETVDSRGYPNSTTVTPQMIDYVPLTINANFFRPQPTTGEVKLKYSGNYFDGNFGAKQNSIGIEWHYRVKGSNTWIKGGNITPTISENKIVEQTISLGTNFDYQTAYEFYIYAQDYLTSFSTTASVSVGMPVFYWGKDFMSVNQKLIPVQRIIFYGNWKC